jgi:hypothetical protein
VTTWLYSQLELFTFAIVLSMVVITNHESDYGKNNYNHEEKMQYAYLAI